jgi:hypothetical protein
VTGAERLRAYEQARRDEYRERLRRVHDRLEGLVIYLTDPDTFRKDDGVLLQGPSAYPPTRFRAYDEPRTSWRDQRLVIPADGRRVRIGARPRRADGRRRAGRPRASTQADRPRLPARDRSTHPSLARPRIQSHRPHRFGIRGRPGGASHLEPSQVHKCVSPAHKSLHFAETPLPSPTTSVSAPRVTHRVAVPAFRDAPIRHRE